MSDDIRALSNEEIKEKIASLQQLITERTEQEVRLAKEEIMRIAREHNIRVSFQESPVVRKSSRVNSSSGKVYVNPLNSTETWQGRGKRPGWLKSLLDHGHTLDEYLKV